MLQHRLLWRGLPILIVCLMGAFTSIATAGHTPGTSQLGGWTYIDRNNDGQLAFIDDPNPEFVIDNVQIRLFSKVGSVEKPRRGDLYPQFSRQIHAIFSIDSQFGAALGISNFVRPLWSICLGWFCLEGLISRMRPKQRGRQKRTK